MSFMPFMVKRILLKYVQMTDRPLFSFFRGQPGLALQSKKIGVRRHGHGPQKKKGLPAIQKSQTNTPSASPAEF